MNNISIIGGVYDIDYADDEEKWELVRYDEEAEEWECTGIYCDNELYAWELKTILNETKGDNKR